jgi:hypothetical protein
MYRYNKLCQSEKERLEVCGYSSVKKKIGRLLFLQAPPFGGGAVVFAARHTELQRVLTSSKIMLCRSMVE